MEAVSRIRGTLFQRDERWEMVTSEGTVAGTLEGHPHEAHVFTDEAGQEYRID